MDRVDVFCRASGLVEVPDVVRALTDLDVAVERLLGADVAGAP